jgi:ornithine carbamoyltransferase
MKTDLEHKLRAGLDKGQKNLDVMMDMMRMRSGVQNKYLAEERHYFDKTAYRPYQVKNPPLSAKDNNSVLMSCILPVVRNKKIVDYRIQQKDSR